jgi:hypothetical protein
MVFKRKKTVARRTARTGYSQVLTATCRLLLTALLITQLSMLPALLAT